MKRLTKKQTELAFELSDRVLKAAKSFAKAHKEELGDGVVAIVLKSLALSTARIIATESDTEEDAQYNAEVLAKELMEMTKALKSETQE